MFALLVGEVQIAGYDLQDLKAFYVAAVEGEEVEEVICHHLSMISLVCLLSEYITGYI